MTGTLVIAGLGPGSAALMTPQVAGALMRATDIVGYGPYVARLAPREGVKLHVSDNGEELDRARQALALAAAGRHVVVVSSGDPGVFAMASTIFEVLESAAEFQALDIQVLPGVTAMLAAAARIGAPLGHDFCVINLSDNLKPWSRVEQRIRLAVEADFAMALYNPRSASRPHQFARTLDLLRDTCGPQRLIMFARAVTTPDEHIETSSLAEARPEMADMRTVVLVGNAMTRRVGPYIYTPRRGE